jgi:hypothetical protein
MFLTETQIQILKSFGLTASAYPLFHDRWDQVEIHGKATGTCPCLLCKGRTKLLISKKGTVIGDVCLTTNPPVSCISVLGEILRKTQPNLRLRFRDYEDEELWACRVMS